MSDKTEYKVNLVQSEAVIKPDELIAGIEYHADKITVSDAGSYKRGTLLMAANDGYVNATAEGIANGYACILCDDITVPDGKYIETAGYFTGVFKADAVILPYEGEDDNHGALIEGIRGELRKQNIFLV